MSIRAVEHRLVVEFAGESFSLCPSESLDFGRQATLTIDSENRFLHRRLGIISFRDGAWWITNVGRSITIEVHDLTSRSQITLAPGRDAALAFPSALVRFVAGSTTYEFELDIDVSPPLAQVAEQYGSETISVADLPLTIDQRRLIVALAEHALSSPGAEVTLPTNRAAAHRLGWTITRFNRKLDNVCARLTKAGVSGLRGSVAELATDRRRALVDHALTSGLVSLSDLDLLDQ